MEAAIKILGKSEDPSWDYDEGADVLYLSVGEPRKAVGVDEDVGAHYDEEHKEVVGVALIGLRARVLKELGQDL